MKGAALVLALALSSTATARADATDARAAYEGTWHGTGVFYDTVYSKPGPSSDSMSCTWQGDRAYLVCVLQAQTPYGAGQQLTVYARDGERYVFQRIEPNGNVHSAEVSVQGNTWTYSSPFDDGDKHVLFRTINVFDGTIQRWHSEFSIDSGRTWTRSAQGVETRTPAP